MAEEPVRALTSGALVTLGRERTVNLLYARQAQEMFGFVRRLGLADEDASDAVQEAMLRLWRELESGAEIADPEAWSYRVLYRIGVDHHRFRRRLSSLVVRLTPGGRPAVESDPARCCETETVWLAVDRLPKRQRAVLYLRYRSDLPYERIGRILGISAGAARGHASTGLATLRRLLGEAEP
jgi:RNA polymerase sigma factor (sigma-70 family)